MTKAPNVGQAGSGGGSRSQLLQLVAGLTEGVILVDPDGSIVWANACALAMHGLQAIEGLGLTAAGYRQRFELRYRNQLRLADAAYPMDRLAAGDAFDDVVVEVAPVGDPAAGRTHRIRGLILADAQGDPGCFALILSDESERYDAEQRFERTFGSNPAPAVILRLADRRYVKVNAGFLALTGYAQEEILGQTLYELDVLAGIERRDLAVERLREGRVIPQMEALLPLADRSTRLVVAAGQPIALAGEACMLFTFADLEPRRKAETALRRSEERFSIAFRMAPIPMAICSLGTGGLRFTFINAGFQQATGYAEAEIIGHSPHEQRLWQSPEERKQFEALLRETGRVHDQAARLRTKDGVVLDCMLCAEMVSIGEQPQVLLAFSDVTARRRTEAELAAAIEAVMSDASWFSRRIVDKLAQLRRPEADVAAAGTALTDLTARGREVLALVSRGLDNVAIGAALGISAATVRNHVNALYAQTDTHSRAALVIWARERGFLDARMVPPGRTSPTRG